MSFHETLFKPTLKLPEKNVLEFIQSQEAIERSLSYIDTREILYEIDERRAKLPKTKEAVEGLSDIEIRAYSKEADTIKNALDIVKRYEAVRTERIQQTLDGLGEIVEQFTEPTIKDKNKMTENIALRAFQKMITTGMKTMTDEEQRALDLSGSAVVVPQSIHNNLITSEAYSDLIYRATQFHDPRPGKIQVPIASNTAGVFHTELDPITEGAPTLTSLELGGFEIARLLQVSASAASMAAPEFENMLVNLLASEVLVGIEESVIKGTGTNEPKGLKNLTWTVGTNAVTATTSIKVADIASALGLLPAKYSKGAVILMNSKTLYALAQAESTGGSYAFNLAEASEKFMGRELVINEHIEDNYAYVVNPRELYIRWSMPLQMEVDKSAGFTSFSQYLRAAAVMDAKWNQKACVQVKVGV